MNFGFAGFFDIVDPQSKFAKSTTKPAPLAAIA